MNANTLLPLTLDDPTFRLDDSKPKPEFMLIGGMKCGSTSFATYLSAHPQVILKGPKEPNYWSWHRYPARYQEFFINETPLLNPGPEQTISGEFSTSSLIHPLVPRRVLANLPHVKIFILLRNPVDRAYSHFMMSKAAGLEKDCSFEEIVAAEMTEIPELLVAHEKGFLDLQGDTAACYRNGDGNYVRVASHERGLPKVSISKDPDLRDYYYTSYLFRSIYYDQVYRWLRICPREQIMIIQSESFFSDEARTMKQVCEFLGLRPFEFEKAQQLQRRWDAGSGNPSQAPQPYSDMSMETRRTLTDFFEPFNRKLYHLIGHEFDWA